MCLAFSTQPDARPFPETFCHSSLILKGSEDQLSRRLASLFESHDFCSLLSKGLSFLAGMRRQSILTSLRPSAELTCSLRTDEERLRQLKHWNALVAAIVKHPASIRKPLHQDYLKVLDHLRAASGWKGSEAVTIWERLAAAAGIEEGVLRAELRAKRREDAGGYVGCSWFKCVMYRQDCDAIMFRCDRCHRTTYCSEECLDKLVKACFSKTLRSDMGYRDWLEGSHKKECVRNRQGLA